MKKTYLLYLLITMFVVACQKDDGEVNRNQNIPNVAFDTGGLINTNLPQYNNLLFPGNAVVLSNNYGINGVVVYYVGGSIYRAYELSDPNIPLSSCSRLTVDSLIASSTCDNGNSYNIATGGLPEEGTTGQFSLVPYTVEVSGNIIRVFNN